jgi:chemotaxis signal transduction protein
MVPASGPPGGAAVVTVAEAAAAVTFRVGDRDYGLDIRHVVEIVRMVAVRPLPGAPPWLAGVVNVRGQVTRVVDLRARLHLQPRPSGLDQVILFVHARGGLVGLIADRADGVVTIPADAAVRAEGRPGAGSPVGTVVPLGDRLLALLDPDALCGSGREGSGHTATHGLPAESDASQA